MQAIAKGLLMAILLSIVFLLFVRIIFFFPWYMTIITEGFQLAQIASNDNYIKQTYYDTTLDRMKDRPIFRDKADDITIEIRNADNAPAVGDDDARVYAWVSDAQKPYKQRGKPIAIKITAIYPLVITLWGTPIEAEIPVSFSLSAIGTKFYKDLPPPE